MAHRPIQVFVGSALAALLAITGLTFAAPPADAAVEQLITIPDPPSRVVETPSMMLDANGFPVVAYHDDNTGNLKVLRCGDERCSAGNTITSPASGDITTIDLTLDANGFPVIAYFDLPSFSLRVLHCGDAACNAGNTVTTVLASGGLAASIELDTNGYPVISAVTGQDLEIVHCGDANCSVGNTTSTITSTGNVSTVATSLALDASGNPVVAFIEWIGPGNDDLDVSVLHCADPNCTTLPTVESPDAVGGRANHVSLQLNASGYPVIAYHSLGNVAAPNSHLRIVTCGDANCSTGNIAAAPDSAGSVGWQPSLALNSIGYPVVAYVDATNSDLKLLACGDATCSTGNTITNPASEGAAPRYPSLMVDALDNPVVSFADVIFRNLQVMRCVDEACATPVCNGYLATIDMNTNGGVGIGTADDDVILGTTGPDLINGLEGDDYVCAGGGDDRVRGGPGDDFVFGEAGADNIRGGGGADNLEGGNGDDELFGQGGPDIISGGPGNDELLGQGSADAIGGDSGDDVISGQNGADSLLGGPDSDTVRGGTGPDNLVGDTGDDTLIGGSGADTLYGSNGFDRCAGNTGPDSAHAASCEQTPGVETLF